MGKLCSLMLVCAEEDAGTCHLNNPEEPGICSNGQIRSLMLVCAEEDTGICHQYSPEEQGVCSNGQTL